MWRQNKRAPICEFLGWTFLINGISYAISIIGEQTGILSSSIGGMIDTVISTFIGTASPLYATYIVLKRHGDISCIAEFIKRIFQTQSIKKTAIITVAFSIAMFIPAILVGERTDYPWYMIVPAVPIMILGGGYEEIGWRGFLQPELEKRMPYTLSVLVVSAIWFAWHAPLWLISSSNQSTYDFVPYLLQLTVNAFALAAIYSISKSTIACVIFHAWGNAIGSLYEWKMFAIFPISNVLIIYDCVVIIASIAIHIFIAGKMKKQNI